MHYINNTYQRTGFLWEGRYKSSLVQNENHLLTCYRYIELNPVRAMMVDAPGDYQWSSYHCNAYGKTNDNIKPHKQYMELGESREQCCHQYRELFRNHIDDKLLHEIREAVNKEWIFCNERFKDEIKKILQRRGRPGKPGRPRVEEVER